MSVRTFRRMLDESAGVEQEKMTPGLAFLPSLASSCRTKTTYLLRLIHRWQNSCQAWGGRGSKIETTGERLPHQQSALPRREVYVWVCIASSWGGFFGRRLQQDGWGCEDT